MNAKTTAWKLTAVTALALLLTTDGAAAYIDPGSGSFFVQMLLAGILGAGMAIKSYWSRIKSFFGGSRSAPPSDDEPSE